MLRLQLVLCLGSSLLVLFVAHLNYVCLLLASCALGYALSSIFPLAMTLVNDYDFDM